MSARVQISISWAIEPAPWLGNIEQHQMQSNQHTHSQPCRLGRVSTSTNTRCSVCGVRFVQDSVVYMNMMV